MLVTVEIPDHVVKELHLEEATRSRQLLEAILFRRFAEGKISVERVAEALGFGSFEVEQFLSLHTASSEVAPGKQDLSEWKAKLDVWATQREPVKHFADDSRENIYAGRDE